MYKILLIDDEKAITEGIRLVVEGFELGFDHVQICNCAEDALKHIDEFRPDIIITDIMMLDMDGLEFCEKIRGRTDEFAQIPLIIISGYNKFEYAKKAINSNVLGYLTKPLDKQELFEVLKKAIYDIEKKKKAVDNDPQQMINDMFYKCLSQPQYLEAFEEMINDTFNNVSQSQDLVFRVMALPGKVHQKSEFIDIHDLIDKIREVISNDKEANNLICWCVYQSFYLMLFCFPQGKEYYKKNGYMNIIKQFTFTEQLQIFISNEFFEIKNIAESFDQIKLISKYTKLIKFPHIVTFAEIEKRNEKGPLDIKEIRKIIKAIDEANTVMLIKQLDSLEQFIICKDVLNIDYIISLYQNLYNEVYNYFYPTGFFQKHPQIAQTFLSFEETLDQIIPGNLIYLTVKSQMITLMRAYSSGNEGFQSNDIIVRIKEFVDIKYADPDLSLQMISERFNMNASYLSSLFKKEIGINFNEYMIRKRINRAIQLLTETDLPITEISRNVGYLSDKHFFVLFKNQQGVSPAKYRKQR